MMEFQHPCKLQSRDAHLYFQDTNQEPDGLFMAYLKDIRQYKLKNMTFHEIRSIDWNTDVETAAVANLFQEWVHHPISALVENAPRWFRKPITKAIFEAKYPEPLGKINKECIRFSSLFTGVARTQQNGDLWTKFQESSKNTDIQWTATILFKGILIMKTGFLPWLELAELEMEQPPIEIPFLEEDEEEDDEKEEKDVEECRDAHVLSLQDDEIFMIRRKYAPEEKHEAKSKVKQLRLQALLAKIEADRAEESFYDAYDLSEAESTFSQMNFETSDDE